MSIVGVVGAPPLMAISSSRKTAQDGNLQIGKFATKSFEGTGLGLYISKNIVEVEFKLSVRHTASVNI